MTAATIDFPSDWLLQRLGDIFSFANGVNADKASYGKGCRFINVLETITYSHIHGPEVPGRITLPSSVLDAYIVDRGDILFNRTSETDADVGLASAYVGEERVVFGGFVIRGRPVKEAFDSTYAGYALRAPFIRSQVISMGQGAIRSNIGQEGLKRVVAPVPPAAEQRAIAKALSDVDALLAGLDRLIAKKRDLKQAAMQQLLTERTRLPGFEGEWSMQPFGQVLGRLNAKRHQIQVSEYQSTGTYPVVDQGKDLIVGYSDQAERRFRCPKSGVIVFGDHTCIVKFVDFDFLVGADGTQVLASRPGQSTRFHAYQLQHVGMESTGYNRHFGQLKNRSFVVPPFAEQTAIAGVLSGMDAELKGLELRRQKSHALKQAMMQELLTGRIRLI